MEQRNCQPTGSVLQGLTSPTEEEEEEEDQKEDQDELTQKRIHATSCDSCDTYYQDRTSTLLQNPRMKEEEVYDMIKM